MSIVRDPGAPAWALPNGKVHRLTSRSAPDRDYLVYIPRSGGGGAQAFVAIHGISRNVDEHASAFAPFCERYGVVMIAPHFAPETSGDYQRLGREGRGPRADLALHGMLEEAARLTGADTARIHLFGFSGGAQFAHRYTMAHPHRVGGTVIAAAGWYTFPDPLERYPYGIRRCRALRDLRFDPEEFLRVPIAVIVGDRDVTDQDLRTSGRVNRQQGRTRLERAHNWVTAMREAAAAYRVAPLVTLQTIPGGDHSFATMIGAGRLAERTFAALFGPPRAGSGAVGHD